MIGDVITPAGLQVELTRHQVRDGQSDEADRWMRMLNDRREECLATLARDGLALEVVFRMQEGGEDVLYWFELRRAGISSDAQSVPEELRTPLDADHLAFARKAKVRGHTSAQPQLVLIPLPLEEALRDWLQSARE